MAIAFYVKRNSFVLIPKNLCYQGNFPNEKTQDELSVTPRNTKKNVESVNHRRTSPSPRERLLGSLADHSVWGIYELTHADGLKLPVLPQALTSDEPSVRLLER